MKRLLLLALLLAGASQVSFSQEKYTLTETFSARSGNRKWIDPDMEGAVGKGVFATNKSEISIAFTGNESRFEKRHKFNRRLSLKLKTGKAKVGIELSTDKATYVLFLKGNKWYATERKGREEYEELKSGKCENNSNDFNTVVITLNHNGNDLSFAVNGQEVHSVKYKYGTNTSYQIGSVYNPDGASIEIKEVDVDFLPSSFYRYSAEDRAEDLTFSYPFVSKPYHDRILVKNNDGKYGYMDEKGQIVVDFQYDAGTDFAQMGNRETVAVVRKNGSYYVINKVGAVQKGRDGGSEKDLVFDSLSIQNFEAGVYGNSRITQINYYRKDGEKGFLNEFLTVNKAEGGVIGTNVIKTYDRTEQQAAVNALLSKNQSAPANAEKNTTSAEKEEVIEHVGIGYTIFKTRSGVGIRNENGLLLPPVFDKITPKNRNSYDNNTSLAVTAQFGDYEIDGFVMGSAISGKLTCNACWGRKTYKQNITLKGKTTKSEITSYVGNGVYEKITIYTRQPDEHLTLDAACTRCDGAGELKGRIYYSKGKLEISYLKDELNNSYHD